MNEDITSPEGAEDISTTPEEASSSVSAETAASEDTTTVEAGQEAEEPWFVPGKFRRPEDMMKSYEEIQSAFHRSQGELAAFKKQSRQQPTVDETKWFAEEVQRNPVEAIRKVVSPAINEIKNVAREAQLKAEYTKLAANEDFSELEPVMRQIAMNNEDLITQNDLQYDPRVLHLLYYAARGVKMDERLSQERDKAKKRGETTALRKQKAQVEGSSSSKGNVSKPFNKLSLDEMERVLASQGLVK